MNKNTDTQTVKCPKCNGRGNIEVFGHYANGVCFECGGAGQLKIESLSSETLRNQARYAEMERTARYEAFCLQGSFCTDDLAEAVRAVLESRRLHKNRAIPADYHVWDRKNDCLVTRGEAKAAMR